MAPTVSGCQQRKKLEAWEGRLQEPAWGRTLALRAEKAFGDLEGRRQRLHLLWTPWDLVPPSAPLLPLFLDNIALLLQAPGPQ